MNSLKIPANTGVLNDIRITIDFFVHKQKIQLTPSKGWLARKILFELNGYLKNPEEGLNDRSDQYKYPRLHFLFHILTAGKLFEKVMIKNKPFLIPNLAHIQAFRSLNDTEQFFFILRTFWLYCNWEQMQLNADMRGFRLFGIGYTLAEIPKLKANEKYVINRTMILENPLLSGLTLIQDMFIHFSYLGWFELELAPDPYWKGRDQMESVTLTQAGKDFLTLLVTHRPFDLWNRNYRYYKKGEYGVPLGIEIDWEKVNEAKTREEARKIIDEAKSRVEPFLKAFKLYLPKNELVNCPDFSITKPQPGVYTFKVVLAHDKKIWRRVQVNGEESLYELHKIIQESVNFDNDHLFAFY
ncbi:MAG: hypothetical protein KDD99_18575, partial [Bacteroidetes bacterium]|nr:hypothetical protein [Bacteroidota bacterium]